MCYDSSSAIQDAARFSLTQQLPEPSIALMSRGPRQAPGGYVYHVLNRAVARLPLFEKPADYAAFLRTLGEALVEYPMRILSFTLMPNHWHFLLWPEGDRDLTNFCRWLTHTHSMRWHAHYHTSGTGHIYQGRFKSFAVEADAYLYTVARYIERNPLRANLVQSAEQWRWSDAETSCVLFSFLPLPERWLDHVNEPQTEAELQALRRSVQRNCPFGSSAWQTKMATRQGLDHTLRPLGRPKKASLTEEAST
jgi:putative transposase